MLTLVGDVAAQLEGSNVAPTLLAIEWQAHLHQIQTHHLNLEAA
jgi:hypothetical protein